MKYHRLRLSKQIKQSTLCLCAFFSLSSCFAPEESKAPCKGLHKVENIDDLLGQFYANIDSHCLFEIPRQELEDIWKLKVFDFRIENIDEQYVHERWKYDKEGYGIYVVIFKQQEEEYFHIFPTTNFMRKEKMVWGKSNLSIGILSTLPQSDKKDNMDMLNSSNLYSLDCRSQEDYQKSEFNCWSYQIWFNKKKSKQLPVLQLVAHDLRTATTIAFCKTAKCNFY